MNLTDFLAPGVEADDIPELRSLLMARPIVGAFISLFRGSDAEVLLRLLVLREIGQETDSPRWSSDALRQRFTYIDPVKLETVLKRLRDHSLLIFGEDSHYHLSDPGRNAVSALTQLLQFSAEEDIELGFLTAQLAGLSATGSLNAEALGHLLSKLNDLTWHFEEAIASGSEFRIIEARSRLQANGRWLERGTEILRQLLADPEASFELARIAQRLGLAQSRLARVDAAFQRALNTIETQRVTLGGSGISSSDVTAWLRQQNIGTLSALLSNALTFIPSPALLAGGHELLDRAETTLSEETQYNDADSSLPEPEPPVTALNPEYEDLRLLEHFTRRLENIQEVTPLHQIISGGGFTHASYRFSLLTLLGQNDISASLHSHPSDTSASLDIFTQLPFNIIFSNTLITPNQDEIASITEGYIQPCA